jgi:hypothetical protein
MDAVFDGPVVELEGRLRPFFGGMLAIPSAKHFYPRLFAHRAASTIVPHVRWPVDTPSAVPIKLTIMGRIQPGEPLGPR